MSLLDTYEDMKKAASAEQGNAEEEKLASKEDEVLQKYAELADNLLADEYDKDYKEDDVIKLAEMLIDHDSAVSEEMDKVAELAEAGTVMARAFIDEVKRSQEKTE